MYPNPVKKGEEGEGKETEKGMGMEGSKRSREG
jgi:hypothetical protein